MQDEKRSLRSKISFGLIILTPLTLILYLVIKILKASGEVSYEVFWKHFYPNIFWLVAAFSGVVVYIAIAILIDWVYHSNKTWFSSVIDNFMLNIPLVKHFWHARRFDESKMLDFSKVKAAIIDLHDGVWELVFITGRQEFERGCGLTEILITSREKAEMGAKNQKIVMARGINPTIPIPVTGFFHFIDEVKLRRCGRIIYLKNAASELFKIYLSGGFIGPERLIIDKNG